MTTEQRVRVSEATRSLDIGANLIGRWHRQFTEEPSGIRPIGEEPKHTQLQYATAC